MPLVSSLSFCFFNVLMGAVLPRSSSGASAETPTSTLNQGD